MATETSLTTNGYVKLEDEVRTIGHRHLIQLLDHYAKTEPDRAYLSIPVDQKDLSAGFKDVSYGAFANAVDHCVHWLNSVLPLATEPFETVAYSGPRDIRYPMLACALAKLERKLLFPSPAATPAGQAHLVRKTECRTFFYGGLLKPVVESVVAEVQEWQVQVDKVSEVEEFLREEKAREWPWKKSWNEARDLPWLILHTSGTTGFPKPIILTHEMLVLVDASKLMPEFQGVENRFDKHLEGRRWFNTMPTLHVSTAFPMLSVVECESLTTIRWSACTWRYSGPWSAVGSQSSGPQKTLQRLASGTLSAMAGARL